jgi:hypothetical protein
MKKIIRLTESDLMRLVRRVINEQDIPSNHIDNDLLKKTTPDESARSIFNSINIKNNYIGKTVNFYKDKENKMFLKTGKIFDVLAGPTTRGPRTRFTVEINFTNQKIVELEFNCNYSNNGFKEINGKLNSDVYSNSLSNKLKKDFCMTNKSGVQVPKADFASTNNSQDDSQNDLS